LSNVDAGEVADQFYCKGMEPDGFLVNSGNYRSGSLCRDRFEEILRQAVYRQFWNRGHDVVIGRSIDFDAAHHNARLFGDWNLFDRFRIPGNHRLPQLEKPDGHKSIMKKQAKDFSKPFSFESQNRN